MRQSLNTVLNRTYFLLKYFHNKPVIQVPCCSVLFCSVLQPSEIPPMRYKNIALQVKLRNCWRITTMIRMMTVRAWFDVPVRIHLPPSIKHKHFQELREVSDSHNSVADSHVFWDVTSSPPMTYQPQLATASHYRDCTITITLTHTPLARSPQDQCSTRSSELSLPDNT
jgi:hypothetical protein